jgi:hypothetical protein
MSDHFTKKLMMLQNMIIESKDFGIWTQYFIQDFIFLRRTLLYISNSAIDIWEFFVNILCKETDMTRESAFTIICITLTFIRSE